MKINEWIILVVNYSFFFNFIGKLLPARVFWYEVHKQKNDVKFYHSHFREKSTFVSTFARGYC